MLDETMRKSGPVNPIETNEFKISVKVDGTVPLDNDFDGPQIKKVRLLKEGTFLEIYWDRYVDEVEAVNTNNFVFKNGGSTVQLQPKTNGNTNTLYFDKDNREVVATKANSMSRLSEDIHMSSICFCGAVDATKGFSLEVKGSSIKDKSGRSAKSALYKNVPQVSFYTQHLMSDTGIDIKADDTVKASTIKAAAKQVDIQLGRTETGIAANMASYHCSLAIYSPHENVYFIPEQRYGFNLEMYDVEGYGGNLYDNCVSSIAERNVLRIRGEKEDPDLNTGYANENILIHEFGHCMKSVGMDLFQDQTIADEFYAVYQNAKEKGLWPNTYAASNSDEFFATMCTVWFNVMAEAKDWENGVRCPLNTKAEMKKYDPMTYAFFAKILPDETLPAPWDKEVPDIYHEELIQPPTYTDEVADINSDFANDVFRIQIHARGDNFEIDRNINDGSGPKEDMCIWPLWGTDDGAWAVTCQHGHYSFSSPAKQQNPTSNQIGAITADSAETVSVIGHEPNAYDPAQQWDFVADMDSPKPFDGCLVNVKYGTALALAGSAMGGATLRLVPVEKGDQWMIRNATQSAVLGKKVYISPSVAD